MEYFFASLALILIIFLFLKIKNSLRKEKYSQKNQQKTEKTGSFANCPICSSSLIPGVSVRSKVFKTENSNDQLCYVYGCSNCYPKNQFNLNRTCPVCHKTLEQDDYLLSRIFYHTKSGRPHVIINGCQNCNRKK